MPLYDNHAAFLEALPAKGSLLALDVSKRRIGLAGSDAGRRLATPLHVIQRKGVAADLKRIAAVVHERGAVGIVLGLPLNMDGSEGPMAKAMRAEAEHLEAALRLPLLLQDERLTTEAVRQAISEGRLRRLKPGLPIDHYAAVVILDDAIGAFERDARTGQIGPAALG